MKIIGYTFLINIILGIGLWSCDSDDPKITVTPPEPPTVTEVAPSSGPEGTEVTITGTGFGTSTSAIEISFNGEPISAVTSTETSITTTVPDNASTGTVIVKIGTTVVQGGPTFTVTPPEAPTVVSYDPTSALVGASVTITGTNFSETAAENVVSFNGAAATVTAATTTELTTTVPNGATTGTVTVTVEGQTGFGPEFTVEVPAPTVVSYDPVSAPEGATVTITGANFSTTPADNAVSFNGTAATVTAATETSITTTVPSGATTGTITVTVGGQTGTGPSFTVVDGPAITSLDRTDGYEGTTIIISGGNFSAVPAENTVSFNGTAATVTASTATTITTTVPSGATTGTLTVTVGGVTATGPSFTVLDVVTSGAVVIALESDDDDVEEIEVLEAGSTDAVGDIDLGSSDLEIGEMSSGQGLMIIGLRFNNVPIAQGATIASASVQFRCDATGADPVEVTLYGEDVGNAAPYDGTNGEVSGRSLTTANAVWAIPEWVATGDRLAAQQTVDLKDIIQEIVNRGDWVPGNSINIIMKNTGVSAGATATSGGREAENYSSSTPEDSAELTITL